MSLTFATSMNTNQLQLYGHISTMISRYDGFSLTVVQVISSLMSVEIKVQ